MAISGVVEVVCLIGGVACPLRHCPLVSWRGESSHNVWFDGEPADAMPPLRPYVQNGRSSPAAGRLFAAMAWLRPPRLPERL